ncbi:MAG TPA: lysophospholipid acyltransferase family protein [Bacillota bacterium]|nr:lysophospholipid acyltransferase family protein [Bacillota bacterium]
MYEICRRLVWLWFKLTARPQVFHAERIPLTGPAIIAGNHMSAVETVLIPSIVHRKLGHVAKSELFTSRKPFHRLLGWFIHWAGARPMDRSGGRMSASSMDDMLTHLRKGGAAVVFPEGTRAPDERMYKGKTGVARLALAADVPVIPVGIVNTRKRKVGWWPWPIMWKPEVHWGEPLDFSQWAGCVDDRGVVRHVTDEVMAAIQQLTGQTYVDVYAASLRSATKDGRELAAPELPRPGYGKPVPQLPEQSGQDAGEHDGRA